MATRSKNISYHISVKIIAFVLLVIALSVMSYSIVTIGSMSKRSVKKDFYYTEDFANSYFIKAHQILQYYLYKKNPEEIKNIVENIEDVEGIELSEEWKEKEIDIESSSIQRFKNEFNLTSSFLFYFENMKSGEIMTNVENQDAKAYILDLPTSVVFEDNLVTYPESSQMEELLPLMNSNYWYRESMINVLGTLEKINESRDEDWTYITAVSSTLSKNDKEFYLPKVNYDTFIIYESLYYTALILSILLVLFLSAYFIFVSGKKSKDSKAEKTIYDGFYMELQTLLTITMCTPLIGVYSSMHVYSLANYSDQLLSLIGWGAFYTFLLIQVLSIIRLVKTQKLKDSFLIIRLLKALISMLSVVRLDSKYKKKMLLYFILYFLLSMFFIVLMYEVFLLGFSLLIVLNLFVLIMVFRLIDKYKDLAEAIHSKRLSALAKNIDISSLPNVFKPLAQDVMALYDGLDHAVEERMRGEKMKTELITNVTHDLKNPLTSIINYVTLLKKCEVENQEAKDYIQVLDEKAIRLKALIEQLVEASKASTGNMEVQMETIDFIQLNRQIQGDFAEKFEDKGLQLLVSKTLPPVDVYADPSILYRIMDNLMTNVYKYAMEQTRVYLDIVVEEDFVKVHMKNISKEPLNIPIEDLSKRFVRGDESRSEEGSGLGLSIALSLADLIGAKLILNTDGDLFKATLVLRKPDEDEDKEHTYIIEENKNFI